jgi:molybdenum cofactor biosynthesis enzyme MoaA
MPLEPVVISSRAPTPVALSVSDIPCLEFPIMHVCNLHCDACRHDASYNIKAIASADQVRTSVAARAEHIKPRMVKILGGEPLAHRNCRRSS